MEARFTWLWYFKSRRIRGTFWIHFASVWRRTAFWVDFLFKEKSRSLSGRCLFCRENEVFWVECLSLGYRKGVFNNFFLSGEEDARSGLVEPKRGVCQFHGREEKEKRAEIGFLSDVTRWASWAGQGRVNLLWPCRCSDWWRRLGVPFSLTASTSLTWGCTTSGLASPSCPRYARNISQQETLSPPYTQSL